MGLGSEAVGWVVGGEVDMCRGIVDDACRERYVCIHKARMVLGYKPRVSLEDGIRRACEWYKGVLGKRVVKRVDGGWS